MVHKAWCKAQGMRHRAWGMLHRAWYMCRMSQTMVYRACCMLHGSMMYRTFSPLFTVSEITDALPHLPSPPMALKSETQLPLINTSEIRDTLPLHFSASEIRGIRCLCFQRPVSDFIDASLISETSWVWNFRKLLITLLTQEIWNQFFQIIATQIYLEFSMQ